MQTQAQYAPLSEALDWAALNGILKMHPAGRLTHAPFSLTPCPVSADALSVMEELTAPFSEMMIRVSRDRDILRAVLEPLTQTDPFLRMLFDFQVAEETQPLQLLIQRNDFFVAPTKPEPSRLRQVELNTISSSFPFLMDRLLRTHRMVFRNDEDTLKRLVPNEPLIPVVDAMAEAIRCYGTPPGCMLMVVQPEESNRFDQLGLAQPLWERHGIETLRKTLPEIGEQGKMREGHLRFGSRTVSLTYYRAGYTPDDFLSAEAIRGRGLIEASSTIQCPDLWMQLAGMKKVQLALTVPRNLNRYAPSAHAGGMSSTFAGMHSLHQQLNTPEGPMSAKDWASRHPEGFVLKPQREGGGNNHFGGEIPDILSTMPEAEWGNYVLMERILPKTHTATLVVDGQSETLECVSEIGRFGIALAEHGTLLRNDDCGYLVRTKSAEVDEGGVCAGYACLNSLALTD